tara:strand:- start:3453 stop:4472 length:1020 start_codon:yes stop_codon:yes gene_type:complete
MTHLAIVQPCEAAYALSRQVQNSLTVESKQRAIDFILEFGTNLQRERLLYHFPIVSGLDSASSAPSNKNVLAALSHYQNEDGGFGHGLEPDLRTKKSTVLATTVAMQIMESVEADHSAMADDAMQYLISHYQAGNWQAIHSEANDAPHAPWWRYEIPIDQGFVANPGAEVMRYLINRRAMATEMPELIQRAINYIQTSDLEMHELLCFVRLYECLGLTKEHRLEILPYLLSNGFKLVNVEPRDWEEYCLTPLAVVTHKESVFAEFFSDTIEANFKFLVEQQQDDGCWKPNWSWAGEFPASWKKAETEIKAELTLKNLQQFAAFNRLPCSQSFTQSRPAT